MCPIYIPKLMLWLMPIKKLIFLYSYKGNCKTHTKSRAVKEWTYVTGVLMERYRKMEKA
jgi:hypothetical protein